MNFFPPSIALDISEVSIKATALKKASGGLFDLLFYGRGYLKEGTIIDGQIKNEDDFFKTIKSIIENPQTNLLKTNYFVASLPEEKAFLRILELPALKSESEFAEALKWEVEANIPLSLDEVYYDYEIIKKDVFGSHYDVMVNAVPRLTVDSYVSFFNKHGWKLLALEVESVAAMRALFSEPATPLAEAILVLDIGASRTSFIVVAEGALRFTSSNPISGNKFSSLITQRWSLSPKEAEFIKRAIGLDKNQKKGRELLEILKPALILLRDQIQSYINFFETHPSRDKLDERAQKISKIILVGGGANLWGLTDWLSQELNLAVILGNPIHRIRATPSAPHFSLEESLFYTTAIGLALRNFDEMSANSLLL